MNISFRIEIVFMFSIRKVLSASNYMPSKFNNLLEFPKKKESKSIEMSIQDCIGFHESFQMNFFFLDIYVICLFDYYRRSAFNLIML